MGNWNINIQGVGCHHNNKPEIDADLQFEEFVKLLKSAGHTVQHATFTSGSLTTPESLAEQREWKRLDAEKNAIK